MTDNLQILLKEAPTGTLMESHFESKTAPMPTIEDGQILVRTVLISLDAAMRAWMRGPTYRPQVMPGDVMPAYVFAEVVESKAEGFAPKDCVLGECTWSTYGVMNAKGARKAPPHRPASNLISVLGIAGLTAYWGLLDIGQPKEGETVVVSAAAGSVGAFVGQIAKIKGCRVIGIAGGAEKCAWLTESLGYDAAVDYKAGDVDAQLEQACPKGIDVYFDNVGGDILQACLPKMRNRGRVVCCGAISQYNAEEPQSPKGVPGLIVVKRLRMEGFIVMDYFGRTAEAAQDLLGWAAQGQLKVVEDIVDGLENAPSALVGLYAGKNRGKLMVRVAPDPA
ncbi:MAG: NADP-dependent oxidoreductase [Myxococcota bacterium]